MSELNFNMNDFVDEEGIDEYLNNLYLELGDVRDLHFDNNLLKRNWYDSDSMPKNVAELCRDPMYLHFVCKYILNVDLLPYQGAMLHMMWSKLLCILIGSRGMAKSYILAVYCVLRAILHQGSRIVVVGAGLRQSLVVWNYIVKIWDNAPVLQDIVGAKNHPKKDLHMAYWEPGISRCVFLPLGTGDKIRGERATTVVGEEFASIPEDIFETVVRGFAAVRSDGVIGNVMQAYKEQQMKKMGWAERKGEEIQQFQLSTMLPGNQIIMAGTANYQFNHFYKYYQYYRAVIMSGGDKKVLKSMFPERDIQSDIPSEHYGIIRMPANVLPPGLMDDNILAQGRATMDPSIFRMEYMACFPSDSEGFYQATTLHKCCVPLKINGENFTFKPLLIGDPNKFYFMGIDPASESDRFAINIQELGLNNRGYCVYQWSTTRKEFEKLKADGAFKEDITDYNTFCVKHIFALLRRFNVLKICLDSGGGGLSIREGLKDISKLMPGELPVLEHDVPVLEKGRKILHTIQFSDASWRKDSHWGLRADFLQQQLLFPEYDAAEIVLADLMDERNNIVFDTVGDIYDEIEQCKIETTYIKYEHTENGIEKWGLPATKIGGQNFQRDRFTSLLLSNWARRLFIADLANKKNPYHDSYGNVATKAKKGVAYNVVKNQNNNGRKIYY